ncbi:MAG: DUF2461 domain-containing protein [Ktedonobacteraceae bacterium]
MQNFQGFPSEAITFFEGLERDNSKTYWEANKAVWESTVHKPMEDLLEDLEEEFPPLRLLRPYRDVRFSKDKSPYKLSIAAASETRGKGGVGLYIQLSSTGLMVAYGAYTMRSDQLERFRAALAHDLYGAQFEKLLSTLAALSLPVTSGGEAPLKTAPLGYTKDHPRIDLLRWKGAVVIKEFGVEEECLQTPQALEEVKAVWHGAEPLKDWLEAHVGPSREPSEKAGTRSR